jgi:capsular polysaccharide biosynthesis protein
MVRRPTNEEEIVRRLTEVGFSVLYLTQYSVQEQVAIFSRAKMIVGTHGAGLSNLVFAQAGTIVYEFFSSLYQPDMHGTLPYGQIARALAMDYTKIVCEAENPDVTPVLSSFHLPLEHIERIVARARSLPLG